MRLNRILCSIVALAACVSAAAQTAGSSIEVDYNNPRKYYVGGVKVNGNTYLGDQQIINLAGLQKGMEVTVPGEQVSAIVNRLWQQRYFQNVSISVD